MQEIYKRENGSIGVKTINNEPTMTDETFKDEVDINNIISKYTKNGILPQNISQGIYADLSKLPHYQEALDTVIQAQNAFDQLPAEMRNHFKNDPQELINFVNDPKNLEEGIKLGIFQKPTTTNEIKTNDDMAIKNTDINKPS